MLGIIGPSNFGLYLEKISLYMKQDGSNNAAVGGFGLLLRLVRAVESLVSVAGEILACLKSGRAFGDAPWLTVTEAAERGRYSIDHVYRLIKQNRLYASGEHRSLRIDARHFDEQLSLNFPVLDYVPPEEMARRAMAAGPVWTPSPLKAETVEMKLVLPCDSKKKVADGYIRTGRPGRPRKAAGR